MTVCKQLSTVPPLPLKGIIKNSAAKGLRLHICISSSDSDALSSSLGENSVCALIENPSKYGSNPKSANSSALELLMHKQLCLVLMNKDEIFAFSALPFVHRFVEFGAHFDLQNIMLQVCFSQFTDYDFDLAHVIGRIFV